MIQGKGKAPAIQALKAYIIGATQLGISTLCHWLVASRSHFIIKCAACVTFTPFSEIPEREKRELAEVAVETPFYRL